MAACLQAGVTQGIAAGLATAYIPGFKFGYEAAFSWSWRNFFKHSNLEIKDEPNSARILQQIQAALSSMKERVQGCEENDQQYNSMQEELLGQINIIEEIKEDTEQATNVSTDLKELLKELKKKKKLDCLSVLYLLPFKVLIWNLK